MHRRARRTRPWARRGPSCRSSSYPTGSRQVIARLALALEDLISGNRLMSDE